MTFKKSGKMSKALVIKEVDNENDKERMDKRAVNQKRLMAMKRALRCGYGCGGGGCGGSGGCGSGGRLRNRWQPIADMSFPRYEATSGVLCGRLVVVGGVVPDQREQPGETAFSSGEMYDPRTNRWQPIADMSVGRADPTGGVVCGRLVVVGGSPFTGETPFSSGEMYDPRTNRWQPITDMSVKRFGATSGVICGRLVVVGGTDDDDSGYLSSGEMYDPRTNRWQPIADMSVGRFGATSGVLCGRLVVVGGLMIVRIL